MNAHELARLIAARGASAEDLRARADAVRHDTVGDAVHLRALIEFSNHCRCHCAYCGLRADNDHLRRFRLHPQEILATACEAERLGFGTVVLQSGEDLWWTADRLADVIAQIKSATSLAVTLSVGEREAWEYRLWREAGADRYLLKHETADRALYERLHPGASFDNRIGCLGTLRELGYQVGAGCIVGLPGQTPMSLAQDLLLLERLRVHMAAIGPFIPHPQTPLADAPPGDVETTLNMLALARLLIPDLLLPATTALETLEPRARLRALRAGANVIMPNVTPRPAAQLYEIYPGRAGARADIADELQRIRDLIRAAGRSVAEGPGHSPRAPESR
jgi:biotin synthase